MVYYWDTSALIPCFIAEEGTIKVEEWQLRGSETSIFTSWLTLFEFETVLRRKLLQKQISPTQNDSIQSEWAAFQLLINFVPLDSRSARQGLRLQRLYGLRPYDSIQLGSASIIQLEFPNLKFACLDDKLNRIARLEGFGEP